MAGESEKRNEIICLRIHPAMKNHLEQIALHFDESTSSIARKCLYCFLNGKKECAMKKRYPFKRRKRGDNDGVFFGPPNV
jgi:hypothetical protein